MELELTGKPPDVVEDSFTVSTNEDWARDYQLKVNGEPIRIEVDWKIYMQMQSGAGALGMTSSIDNRRILVIDRDAGKFGLRVKQADAFQINPDAYDYDIVIVAGDGIYRLARGTIKVEKGITVVPGQQSWSHIPLILRP